MKRLIFLLVVSALSALLVGCSVGTVAGSPSLQQQVAAGGVVELPAGTTTIDCGSQLTMKRTTTLIGQGRDVTILNDTCPTGDTIFVDVSQPAVVAIKDLTVIHGTGTGTDIHLTGGTGCCDAIVKRVLRLESVDLQGAGDCLVSDGQNLLFVERSFVHMCAHDGAQIGSFGVTLRDNWIGQNGHNGATFTGAGFCASCAGNEYWLNKAHGLVYAVSGIADARHVGEYIDSNGDVGLVVNGVRDFTFNSGWIGSNKNGGAIISDTQIGTVIVGNTFTNNSGPSLILTQTRGPLRITGNVSSLKKTTCDAKVNGVCVDLNKM